MRTETQIHYPERGNEDCRSVEDSSYWFAHRNRVIASLLDRWPATGLFADVGGGNGVVAAHLAATGRDVALVEPGPAGCANARARGLRNVREATLESAGFGPAELGGIGAFDVLEHLDDRPGFLSACAARLREGGRLLLTVPAYGFLWSQADDDAGHRVRYTHRTLRREVAAAGFSVEFVSGIFVPLIAAVAIARALPYRLGVRRGAGREALARDHNARGVGARLLASALDWEHRRISAGRPIPAGSSVVLVATKPSP